VTVGTANMFSGTVLTIKDYPFGNEMQAIALQVAVVPPATLPQLLPGGQVTISQTFKPKNSMTGTIISYSQATGAMVCQIGVAFQFEIRGNHRGDGSCDGYGSSSSIGSDDFSAPVITAQLGNGISVVDVGKLQIRIPAATMSKLRHKTYSVAMTMFDGSDTRQVFVGRQPIQDGGVTLMPIAAPVSSNPFGLP
jgi:hypothetical protein